MSLTQQAGVERFSQGDLRVAFRIIEMWHEKNLN